jgi:hypothetical protein
MTRLTTLLSSLIFAVCCVSAAQATPAAGTATAPPGVTSWQAMLPPTSPSPVVVTAEFHLLDLENIDDDQESFEFSGILTLVWRDHRQIFDPAIAGVTETMLHGGFQFNELAPAWYPQVILANVADQQGVQGVLQRGFPDGTVKLIQTVNATARSVLDLQRYPFDSQRLEIIFQLLGFDEDEVKIKPGATTMDADIMRIPQWDLIAMQSSAESRYTPYVGGSGRSGALVVTLDVERESMFMMRLVVLPLTIIMILSWSVFWMDRSSLGDRMSVSFVGILTAVAYQTTVSSIMAQISYMTLIHSFLYFSFLLMCATVVINLVVGNYDRRGEFARGDRIDRHCRWIFPLVSVLLTAVCVGVAFDWFTTGS